MLGIPGFWDTKLEFLKQVDASPKFVREVILQLRSSIPQEYAEAFARIAGVY